MCTIRKELTKFVVETFDQNTNLTRMLMKRYHLDLVKHLYEATSFLPPSAHFKQRMWHIFHETYEIPCCPVCNKQVQWFTAKQRYKLFCSRQCQLQGDCFRQQKIQQTLLQRYGVDNYRKTKEFQEKKTKTTLDKYGVTHYSKTDECKKKVQQTSLDRYNVTHYSKTSECQEKIKQTSKDRYGIDHYSKTEERNKRIKNTCLKKYGAETYSKTEECKKRAKNTCLQKYGVSNYRKTEECKEQIKKTNLKRYGVDNYRKTEECKKRAKNTCLQKYGVDSYTKTEECKKKMRNTNLERYGVNHFKQKHILPHAIETLKDKQWLYNKHHNENVTVLGIALLLGIGFTPVYSALKRRNIPIKRINFSQKQHDLKIFLQETTNERIIENTRSIIKPHELDLYLPSFKLGLEYNGLYWHSELAGKDRSYHLNKTRLCEQQGIRLIHIFENEWVQQQEIVKSRLRYMLKKIPTKIYARRCEIKQVNSTETSKFNLANHIQGHCSSSINYGLYHNNQLVALITFGKARFNTQCQYELLRYSNLVNTIVIGGAGKLYKHFIKTYDPQSVVSYSDKRWNTGNLYRELGFQHSHASSPNYFYFKYNDGLTLYSRIQFQKHKLKDKILTFDPELTEWQNMVANGWNRIWDCGNDVWLWKK